MSNVVMMSKPEAVAFDTGIDKDKAKSISDDLAKVLSDSYLLMVKTHVYHWNVVGPLFLPIHELTEQHYENLFKATDELAERIRALGALTPFSFGDMAEAAKLNEATSSLSAEDMVAQLAKDHEAMTRRIRGIAETAEEAGDFVTHDMLVERMTFHEKAVWMLRAILA